MKAATLALAIVLIASIGVLASNPYIVLFYEETCSSCQEMEDLLAALAPDLTDQQIARHEIDDPGAQELLTQLADAYEIEVTAVPVLFVGETAIVGFGRTQEFALRNALGDCATEGCISPLQMLPSSRLRAEIPRLFIILVLFAWFFRQQTH